MNEPQMYRKKPVEIQALQWTGENLEAVQEFVGQAAMVLPTALSEDRAIRIMTREDGPSDQVSHYASPGDWIIRGVAGEFYPCKPDIFEATYDRVF